MTTFTNYKEAEEFAEIRVEESDERLLVMKKDNEYVVTGDYKEAKNLGYKLITSVYPA